MLRELRTGVLAAFMSTISIVNAAEWTQFRGPDASGVSHERGVPTTWSATENLAWKTELPGPGTSSPIFFGDQILVTCYTGYNVPSAERGEQGDLRRHLLALDRKTGKLRWNTPIKAALPEQDTIRDGHGYTSSTPVADDRRIYCFFGKSGVFAFDHQGKQLWQADVGDGLHGWGSASSPVLFDDLVIVNAGVESESLIAFDAATGKERWRVRKIRETWTTPVIVSNTAGEPELVVAMQGKVLGLDPKTGQERWTCANDITWYIVPSVVSQEGVIYGLGGRSGVASFAIRTGGKGDVTASHRLWTGKKGSNVSSPVLHEGRLYFMNDSSGIAYCLNAKTGDIVYEARVPRADQIYASTLLVDNRVFYVGRSGKTFVVAAKPEFELLAANDLNDRSLFHASPVATDGRLFLRSDKALYCLEQK